MDQTREKIKSWEELTLADNFIFQKFMLDEEMCKKVLSEILGKEVVKVEYPEYEKTLAARRDAKGIRLDVYIKNETEVYNIEMQSQTATNLPKRGRYYQDLIDLDLIEKGQDYSKLCHSYVIFICTYDFYQRNQYKYTFRNKCEEINGLEYGDETTKIVLNTKGSEGDVSKDLKIFLKSIEGIFSEDAFSAKIKETYERVKHSREWRREYMTLEMELKEQREIGEARGIEIGEEKMSRLIELLMQESKTDDIQKVLTDLEYRKKLFKEYNIEVKDS